MSENNDQRDQRPSTTYMYPMRSVGMRSLVMGLVLKALEPAREKERTGRDGECVVEGCMCGLLGHKICHFLTLFEIYFYLKPKRLLETSQARAHFPRPQRLTILIF